MLLSRTAADVYWLGRYLERAEALARVVDQHSSMLVDLPVDVDADWSALLSATGCSTAASEGTAESEVVRSCLADISNPSSLVRTLGAARENLRVTRALVPRAAWEVLNRVHMDVVDRAPLCRDRAVRSSLLRAVVDGLRQLSGVFDASMARDETWCLYQVGRHVERIDQTLRVVTVRSEALSADGSSSHASPADRSPYEDVRWLGVLHALDAHHAYARSSVRGVEPAEVVRFLLVDSNCPRSAAYGVALVERLARSLPERGAVDSALAELDRVLVDGVGTSRDVREIHPRLGSATNALGRLHVAIEQSYFAGGAVADAAVSRESPLVDVAVGR